MVTPHEMIPGSIILDEFTLNVLVRFHHCR